MASGHGYTPNYRELDAVELAARSRDLRSRYADCDLCPHECGVDRTAGELGVCGADDTAVVSSYFSHGGEEAVLSGSGGSGTVFLANCNMGCVFCQNHEVSHDGRGSPATATDIAEMALELQEAGCHNVNFVSPTHYSPTLVEALAVARERGLDVPVIWNCGGYERAAVLDRLDGLVDVYMPDVKWSEDAAATRYSKAPGYWSTTRDSLREMHRQVGDLSIEDGLATDGVLVRHLVMPDHVESAKEVLTFIAEELGRDTYVNLMGQYSPQYEVRENDRYSGLNRRVTEEEYRSILEDARSLGLRRVNTDPGLARGSFSVLDA